MKKEVKMSTFIGQKVDPVVTVAAVAMLAKEYSNSGGVYRKTEEILASFLDHPNKMASALALITLAHFGWDLQEKTKTMMANFRPAIEASTDDYRRVQVLSDLLGRQTDITL